MNQQARESLEELLRLLKIEEEEDRLQYKTKLHSYPIEEKRKQGITWHPVVIKESYYGVGERLILEIERPSGRDIPHLFQAGRSATIFTTHPDYSGTPLPGVVSLVRENNLRITLQANELPEWANLGKFGIDLQFDDNSYREMTQAVKKVMSAGPGTLSRIRDVIYGFEKASFDKEHLPGEKSNLNESQLEALEKCLSADDVAIVHGPPGTGKTTTLVEIISQTLKTEKQVLVCAPSNNAIDLLSEKLDERGFKVVRIGNPARVTEHLLQLTLDSQVSTHPDYKFIKDLKKKAYEFKNLASKYKRSFGKSERDQRRMLMDESFKMINEAFKTENYIAEKLLDQAQVITCTLVGSAFHMMRERRFETVFIDEAAQALEPASWIPILRAERVIFAGDHCQLPATVKSNEAFRKGLGITLFEKAIKNQQADVMLEIQYRMNDEIMGFSNQEFYHGDLKSAEFVKNRRLPVHEPYNAPVEYIDTVGTGYNEELEIENVSVFNKDEAALLINHLRQLLENLFLIPQNAENGGQISVGIISPYKAQVVILKELAEKEDIFKKVKLSVNTVDGFQGQERDVIYISMVRSNDKQEIGFLTDYRRMNVAMTRARKKLVVIGDSSTLAGDPFYRRFLDHMEKINAWKTAWEFIS
jgi:ATP-dependent RNA/DNA helicase IGHMBP2